MTRAELEARLLLMEQWPSVSVRGEESNREAIAQLRAQLAALPEEPAPWTPRERRLWEAMVRVKQYLRHHTDSSPLEGCVDRCPLCFVERAIADTPPPDPRDEAIDFLNAALQALLEGR